jgi:hypothetical protein
MLADGLPVEGTVALHQELVVLVVVGLDHVGGRLGTLYRGPDPAPVPIEGGDPVFLEVRHPALDDGLRGDAPQAIEIVKKGILDGRFCRLCGAWFGSHGR